MYEETSQREFLSIYDECLTPILPVRLPQSQSSKLFNQITLIDDMGLIAETVDTFKPHMLGKQTNRNINTMKIGELWGIRSTRRVLVQGELTKAAQKLKYEHWKDNRKRDKFVNSPFPPHVLDQIPLKTPDAKARVEPANSLRVFSPQLSPKLPLSSKKLNKVDVIDEIIQTCRSFPVLKFQLVKPKKLAIETKAKRKLSDYERNNIKSNIKILESNS